MTVRLIIPVAVLIALASCSKPENQADEFVEEKTGTVFVGAEQGSTGSVRIELTDSWQISGLEQDWFTVYPESGFPGVNELTVTVSGDNAGCMERVGWFTVNSAGNTVRICVVQDGQDGIMIEYDTLYVRADVGQFAVEVRNNIEFSVSVDDSSWLTLDEVSYSVDSVMLADSMHYSRMKTSRIILSAQDNPSDVRAAELVMSTADGNTGLTIVQLYPVEAEVDWDAEFYRKSLGIRFTGSDCAYCPVMALAFKAASQERPDRIEMMNIHGYNNDDPCYYDGILDFVSFYGVTSYPTGIFNAMAVLANNEVAASSASIVALADEALTAYPSMSSISAACEHDKDARTVNINVKVATKEQRDWKIHAFLMENGFVGYQNGAGEDYVFDHILRKSVTSSLGDRLEYAGKETVVEYTGSVTYNNMVLADPSNAYILVFLTYGHEGLPETTGVSGVYYKDFGMIVDNAVSVPVQGSVDFRYE